MTSSHAGATVLVTGGTGYLACWVTAGLLQRGYRVRTTVRSLAQAEQVRGAVSEETGGEAARSVEFAAADLLSDEGWDEAAAGAGYVLHTASPMPFNPGVDLITTAREGTRRVLGAAARAGVARAVLTSSGVTAVTDDPDKPATETVWTEPSGTPARAYPDSKILAERDAWDLAAETGLELSAVLPTFMQGPCWGRRGRERPRSSAACWPAGTTAGPGPPVSWVWSPDAGRHLCSSPPCRCLRRLRRGPR
jgi:dihydroflavonol-4-reductase